MKTVLCFAWQMEAAPWLRLYKALHKATLKQIHYYESDKTGFLISGVGAIRMALAIAWLCGKDNEEKHFVNIGFAASASQPLYSWHEIVKVTDATERNSLYPELLIDSKMTKSDLYSVAKPALSAEVNQYPASLIDMEGYAFITAAKHFVPVTHIHLLKFVSDAGADQFLDIPALQQSYVNTLGKAHNYIQHIRQFLEKYSDTNSKPDPTVLEISEKLHLTFTQQVMLKQAMQFARYYGLNENIAVAMRMAQKQTVHKNDRNRLLQQIVEVLRRV